MAISRYFPKKNWGPKKCRSHPKFEFFVFFPVLYIKKIDLDEFMAERTDAVYLWVAMTHLTPSTFDVLMNLTGGIRRLTNKISKSVTKWYRDIWWLKTNIVATDFFLSNNLVDVARTVNKRRALCRTDIDHAGHDYYHNY